jgi:hypothetical protein
LGALFFLSVFSVLLALIVHRRATVHIVTEWNPARRYLFWGFGLACLGCLSSVALIIGVAMAVGR